MPFLQKRVFLLEKGIKRNDYLNFAPKLKLRLFFFEGILACTAHRALPVIRHVFPLGTSCHTIIRIALFRIVHIPGQSGTFFVEPESCPILKEKVPGLEPVLFKRRFNLRLESQNVFSLALGVIEYATGIGDASASQLRERIDGPRQ